MYRPVQGEPPAQEEQRSSDDEDGGDHARDLAAQARGSEDDPARRCWRPAGACLPFVLTLAVASGLLGRLRGAVSPTASLHGAASAVSAAFLYESKSVGTACANRRSILITTFKSTLEQCSQACQELVGCTGFGFQGELCEDPETWSVAAQTCALYRGQCEEVENLCWDQHYLRSGNVTQLAWQLSGVGKGCHNWERINDGTGVTYEESRDACGYRCYTTHLCVGFGYQETNCLPPEGAGFPGACILWLGRCSSQENPCWDDFVLDRDSARDQLAGETPAFRYPDLWWGIDAQDGVLQVYPYWVDAGTAPGDYLPCPGDWPPETGNLQSEIQSDYATAPPLTKFKAASCAKSLSPTGTSLNGKDEAVPTVGNLRDPTTASYTKWYFVENGQLEKTKFCDTPIPGGLPTNGMQCA